ncbi:UbiX family flavin prenyltransferase [Futiania mangrovi]|uniref:Flavin prenyltransferase UbiX n=1 Tax=Futiania mangrovi TaxID=2959716 RepID=A0A9J6P8H8_9PROT|nr:UbiX family flavin prenyltransferase [Futiania mangrovii]MCP1334861.1 UbiX family flavin prenyltransferase [Futiania mangrovii]
MNGKRLIVGISGASGVAIGVRVLEMLAHAGVEAHLVTTHAADMTIGYETGRKPADVHALAHTVYKVEDVGAALASGSFATMGMIVAPCSMRTLAEIATGVTSNLLTRAADVTLKERRRLVLVARETPLHLGHLRNMVAVTEMGAVVAPPVPAFYAGLETMDEVVTQAAGRALDLFGIAVPDVKRWGEDLTKGRRKGPRKD